MTVFRYFAWFYSTVLVITASVLTMIVVAVTLVESAGNLVAQEDAVVSTLALAGYTAIRFLYLLLPIATLIASLLAGTLLARRGELLACQCSGTPMLHLWFSFGLPIIITAALGILAGDTVVPWAQERITEAKTLGQDRMAKVYGQTLHWFQSGDTILYFPHVNRQKRRVDAPLLFEYEEQKIVRIVRAQRLTEKNGAWRLEEGLENNLREGIRSPFESRPVDLGLSIDDLVDAQGDARSMRGVEIETLIERRNRAGLNTRPHLLEWWSRITYPLSCLFMFLLASPFVFRASPRRSVAVHLGTAVSAVGLLLYVEQVGRLLALGEQIPVPVGAFALIALCIVALPISMILARKLD